MGPIKSYWIDKTRREWEMKQTFRVSTSLLQPDVIMFIGDLLDEGHFSRDVTFSRACEDFESIFQVDQKKYERVILPGNHDVGFHDRMTDFDYPLRRFLQRFRSFPYIERLEQTNTKSLNLIVVNSMMFYNDSCPFCSMAIKEAAALGRRLDQERNSTPGKSFARPIMFKHIPLYRKDDLSSCKHPPWKEEKVKKLNVQGLDVLHKGATSYLLDRIKPRLVISGHTHMECHTRHKVGSEDLLTDIKGPDDTSNFAHEITVSSYNHKFAEIRPGYLLLSVNSTHYYAKHCDMIDEWVVALIYLIVLCIVIIKHLTH